MSNRQFHDAVLRENSIPIALIRAALRGETVGKDGVPAWRWQGDVGASKGSERPR